MTVFMNGSPFVRPTMRSHTSIGSGRSGDSGGQLLIVAGLYHHPRRTGINQHGVGRSIPWMLLPSATSM